jgi:hypothetical protein
MDKNILPGSLKFGTHFAAHSIKNSVFQLEHEKCIPLKYTLLYIRINNEIIDTIREDSTNGEYGYG